MSNEDFMNCWRIPLLRVHFSGSWFYIRLKITETPSLKMLKEQQEVKIPFYIIKIP
jgi:hypothetical protein